MATQGSGILAASSMFSLTALSMKQKSVVNDGGAGCGKSLIYNQPFGVPYVCRVQRGMHFYEAQGDEIFPTSASATASCTSIPIARDVPNRDYSLVDVGGIQGIDGPCRQIIDMYYKSIIIKNVEQRKIMLALKYNDIAERYALFRDTLTGIVKQFTPEGLALRARQCVCIVVTKVPIGVSRDDLRDCLDTKCTALDEGSQERSIFESVIEQGRFLPFYLGEVNQPVPSSFAGELLDMFDNTGYVEKQYIAQDQPAIPDSLQPTVVNMILECISHFCSSVALADIRNSIAAHQWSNRSHAVLLNNLRSWRAFCRSESADVLTPDEFMRELGRTLQITLSTSSLSETSSFSQVLEFLVNLVGAQCPSDSRLRRRVRDWIELLGLGDVLVSRLDFLEDLTYPKPSNGRMTCYFYAKTLSAGSHSYADTNHVVNASYDAIYRRQYNSSNSSHSSKSSAAGDASLDVFDVFDFSASMNSSESSTSTFSSTSDTQYEQIRARFTSTYSNRSGSFPIEATSLLMYRFESDVVRHMAANNELDYEYFPVPGTFSEVIVLESDFSPLPHWRLFGFPGGRLARFKTTDHSCCTKHVLTYHVENWIGVYDPIHPSTTTLSQFDSLKLVVTHDANKVVVGVHGNGAVDPAGPIHPVFTIHRRYTRPQVQLTIHGGLTIREGDGTDASLTYTMQMHALHMNNCRLGFRGNNRVPLVAGLVLGADGLDVRLCVSLGSVTIHADNRVDVVGTEVKGLPSPPVRNVNICSQGWHNELRSLTYSDDPEYMTAVNLAIQFNKAKLNQFGQMQVMFGGAILWKGSDLWPTELVNEPAGFGVAPSVPACPHSHYIPPPANDDDDDCVIQ